MTKDQEFNLCSFNSSLLVKMDAISHILFANAFSSMKSCVFQFKFHWIDNISALFQIMACRRTGDKSLPEPGLAQFTDAYIRYEGGWVNSFRSCDVYMLYHIVVQIIAGRLYNINTVSTQILLYLHSNFKILNHHMRYPSWCTLLFNASFTMVVFHAELQSNH